MPAEGMLHVSAFRSDLFEIIGRLLEDPNLQITVQNEMKEKPRLTADELIEYEPTGVLIITLKGRTHP
jgi:hypothetical protein